MTDAPKTRKRPFALFVVSTEADGADLFRLHPLEHAQLNDKPIETADAAERWGMNNLESGDRFHAVQMAGPLRTVKATMKEFRSLQ